MILSLIRKDPQKDAAEALFTALSAQSRDPVFYADLAVDDSVEGRFELLVLHAYLVLRRLRGAGPDADRLSQGLTDALFSNLDAALREMGVGDLSVAKKIRRMAEAFYGRIGAYEAGLTKDAATPDLADALSRNVFGKSEAATAPALADYVRRANDELASLPLSRVLGGIVSFPAVKASVS